MLTALLSLSILIQAPDTLDASVVRAQRRVSPPVEKATREVLERAVNLAEAIRDFSGVQLRDYGGAGGLKTVNIRSLGSAHTAIFLDGVPIDNAQNMQPDLGRLDVEDLETVELYTGQKSHLLQSAREYGSASSLHMSTAVPKARKTSMRLRGGSFGTVYPSISHEGRIAGAFTGRIRLGGDFSQGNYPFHVTGQDYDTVMVRENGDIKTFRASGGLWYMPQGGRYHISARMYDSERGIPGPVYKQSKEYPMSLDRQADRNFAVQASAEQELSPSVSLLARARYSRDILEYLDISELDPSVSAEWDYDLRSTYVSTALGWQAYPWLHLSGAVDFQNDVLFSKVEARRNSVFTAVSAALLKDPWRASATLQYQSTDDGYSFLSPALLLNWHPRRDWEFGATVKRSCRLPSFNDLYYTNVTSRSLLPEKVWQMSARWCWDRSYGPWHFRANEELYHNRVTDKLIAVPNGSLFRWSMYNLGKVSIWGDEIHADISWNNALGIIARYSFQWAREDGKAFQIPYFPLHSASFNIFGALGAWRLDIKGFLTGSRLTASSTRPEYHLAPWTTWDASLSWHSSRLKGLFLSLDVRNLLNEQYQIVQGYPMPGAYFFLTAKVEL